MSIKLKGAEVSVDVVRLETETFDEHLRTTAAVLCEILHDDDSVKSDEGDDNVKSEEADYSENANSKENTDEGNRCQHCGNIYKSANTLIVHTRLKHPKVAAQVRCNKCNKSYASKLSLEKHTRYMHQYKHRCHVCYRTFISVQSLQQHGGTCTKVETPCPACNKVYDSALSLRNHIKYKHPKERAHLCQVCRRTFTSNRGLLNHTSRIHPQEIICRECSKKFSTVATLQSHFLDKHTENGERCTLCRKVLSSRSSLSRHLTRTHNLTSVYSGESVKDLIQRAMAVCSEENTKMAPQ